MLFAFIALVIALFLSPRALADTPPPLLYYDWDYPGELSQEDWKVYLEYQDPDWLLTHLDHLNQTYCLCEEVDWEQRDRECNRHAAYSQFDYYNRQLNHTFSLTYESPLKHLPDDQSEIWQDAKGYTEDEVHYYKAQFEHLGNSYQLDVGPFMRDSRWVRFAGQKRFFDRPGTHKLELSYDEALEICSPVCKEKWGVELEPALFISASVIAWFPPQPIVW
ncbi:hypothetical protein MMC28_001846 [Mycoblastus sanguinarius]|nr:hypothetical protein [Mycoblastus sanguinarius]